MTIKVEYNIATKRILMTWNSLISMDDQCIIYGSYTSDIVIEKSRMFYVPYYKPYRWNYIYEMSFLSISGNTISHSSSLAKCKTHHFNFEYWFCHYFQHRQIMLVSVYFLACLNYHRTGDHCCHPWIEFIFYSNCLIAITFWCCKINFN